MLHSRTIDRLTDNRSLGDFTVSSSPPNVDTPMDKPLVLIVVLRWIGGNTEDAYSDDNLCAVVVSAVPPRIHWLGWQMISIGY